MWPAIVYVTNILFVLVFLFLFALIVTIVYNVWRGEI